MKYLCVYNLIHFASSLISIIVRANFNPKCVQLSVISWIQLFRQFHIQIRIILPRLSKYLHTQSVRLIGSQRLFNGFSTLKPFSPSVYVQPSIVFPCLSTKEKSNRNSNGLIVWNLLRRSFFTLWLNICQFLPGNANTAFSPSISSIPQTRAVGGSDKTLPTCCTNNTYSQHWLWSSWKHWEARH